MSVKVGISGFGRIGRCITRSIFELERDDIELVKINATGHIESNIHLLKYDSIHGRFNKKVNYENGSLLIENSKISILSERDPSDLDWTGVDIVLECTGKFNSKDKSSIHLKNGAKKVLISAPADGVDKTIVYGVNHETLQTSDLIVSNASCTTNCLAPVAKVIHQELKIIKGFMTTIHSFTGDQPTVDRMHKDLYRARAASLKHDSNYYWSSKSSGISNARARRKARWVCS